MQTIRAWSIAEQIVDDPNVSKFRLEFTSVHTQELAVGNEPPGHDRELWLHIWNESRTRVLKFRFDRNGQCRECTATIGDDVRESVRQETRQEEIDALAREGIDAVNIARKFAADIGGAPGIATA